MDESGAAHHRSNETLARNPWSSKVSPKFPNLMVLRTGAAIGPAWGAAGQPYTVDSIVCQSSFHT